VLQTGCDATGCFTVNTPASFSGLGPFLGFQSQFSSTSRSPFGNARGVANNRGENVSKERTCNQAVVNFGNEARRIGDGLAKTGAATSLAGLALLSQITPSDIATGGRASAGDVAAITFGAAVGTVGGLIDLTGQAALASQGIDVPQFQNQLIFTAAFGGIGFVLGNTPGALVSAGFENFVELAAEPIAAGFGEVTSRTARCNLDTSGS
jgi:hypothetical protein